jgi:hypothetical protein
MNQYYTNLKSSWPIIPYLLAWCFSAFLLSFPSLDGVDPMIRYKIYAIFLGLTLIRLVWARVRNERNKGWLFYIIILVAAPFYFPPLQYFLFYIYDNF